MTSRVHIADSLSVQVGCSEMALSVEDDQPVRSNSNSPAPMLLRDSADVVALDFGSVLRT